MDWTAISKLVPGRNPAQCSSQYYYMEKHTANVRHTPWAYVEDVALITAIETTKPNESDGSMNWVSISKKVPRRNETQCRNRYRYIDLVGTNRLQESLGRKQDHIPIDAVPMALLDARVPTTQLQPPVILDTGVPANQTDLLDWSRMYQHMAEPHQESFFSYQAPTLYENFTPHPVILPHQTLAPHQMAAPSQTAGPHQLTASQKMQELHQSPGLQEMVAVHQVATPRQLTTSRQMTISHQMPVSLQAVSTHQMPALQQLAKSPQVAAPHKMLSPQQVVLSKQIQASYKVAASQQVTAAPQMATPYRMLSPYQSQASQRIPLTHQTKLTTLNQQNHVAAPQQVIRQIPVVRAPHRVAASPQMATSYQMLSPHQIQASQQITATRQTKVTTLRQIPVVRAPHRVPASQQVIAQHQIPARQGVPGFIPHESALRYKLSMSQQLNAPKEVTATHQMQDSVSHRAPAQNLVTLWKQENVSTEVAATRQTQVSTPNQVPTQNSVTLSHQVAIPRQITAASQMPVATPKQVATHEPVAAPVQMPALQQIAATCQMPVVARAQVTTQNSVPASHQVSESQQQQEQQQEEVNPTRKQKQVPGLQKQVTATHKTKAKAPNQVRAQNKMASLHQTPTSQKASAKHVTASHQATAKDQVLAQQHTSGLTPRQLALQYQLNARQQLATQRQATTQQNVPSLTSRQLGSRKHTPALHQVPAPKLLSTQNPVVESQQQVTTSQQLTPAQQTQVVAPNQVPAQTQSAAPLQVPTSQQVVSICEMPVTASQVPAQTQVSAPHRAYAQCQVFVSQRVVASEQANTKRQVPVIQHQIRVSDPATAGQTAIPPPNRMSVQDEVPVTHQSNTTRHTQQMQYSPGSNPFKCERNSSALIKHGPWNSEEDRVLKQVVAKIKDRVGADTPNRPLDWETIAEQLPGRNRIQCRYRYQCIEEKGPSARIRWSAAEDERLRSAVLSTKKHPDGRIDWEDISKQLPGRSRRQCCSHYHYLEESATSTKHGPWTSTEDSIIMEAVSTTPRLPGGRVDWVEVAKRLPGRNRSQCCSHYRHLGDITTKRCRWDASEDKLLKELVFATNKHSDGRVNWIAIAQKMPGRGAKQCGNRYRNIRMASKNAARNAARNENGENRGSPRKRMRTEDVRSIGKPACRSPSLVTIEQNTATQRL